MFEGNFPALKRPDESAEQCDQRVAAVMLDENWRLRLEAEAAGLDALEAALADEQDLVRAASLAEQYQTALHRHMATGVISSWQDEVFAERQQFEATFGQSE